MNEEFEKKKFENKQIIIFLFMIVIGIIAIASIVCAFEVGKGIEGFIKVGATKGEDPKDYYGTYYSVIDNTNIATYVFDENQKCSVTIENGLKGQETTNYFSYEYVSADYAYSKFINEEYKENSAIFIYTDEEKTKAIVLYVTSNNPYKFVIQSDGEQLTNEKPTFVDTMNDPKNYYATYKYNDKNYATFYENGSAVFCLNGIETSYNYLYVNNAWLRHNTNDYSDWTAGIILYKEGNNTFYPFKVGVTIKGFVVCIYYNEYTFSREIFGITYNIDGGINNKENPEAYYSGDTLILREPTKECYEFLGWSGSGIDGIQKEVTIYNCNGDKSFTAHWEKNIFSITYNLDYGINNEENPEAYYSGDTLILREPTKECYEFLGWSGSGIDGIQKEVVIKETTSDLIFTANWKKIINITKGDFSYIYYNACKYKVDRVPAFSYEFSSAQKDDETTGYIVKIYFHCTNTYFSDWDEHYLYLKNDALNLNIKTSCSGYYNCLPGDSIVTLMFELTLNEKGDYYLDYE